MARHPILFLGRALALMALTVLLAVGGSVPRADFVFAATGAAPICHEGAPSKDTPAPAGHQHDCALCPLCALRSLAGTVLAGTPPSLPSPRSFFIVPAQAQASSIEIVRIPRAGPRPRGPPVPA